MDLFADLPPPENKDSGEDLFGDLPAPEEIKAGLKRPHNNDKLEAPSQSKKRTTDNNSINNVDFELKGYFAERKGEREEMQDAHVLLDDFKSQFTDHDLPEISRLAYYAIFDGHAGAEASKFAAKHLHGNIIEKFPKGQVISKDKEIKRCLVDAYRKTDDDFLHEASKQSPVWKDGSTAVSALVINDVLYVANLGDCKALVCKKDDNGKRKVVHLSKDHSPTQYEERLRIQKSGGNVRDGRVLGILEVSRSFGDGRFKGCGVIATPDVLRYALTPNDRFLLLACDGLWKGFEVEEAIDYIDKILQSEGGEDTACLYDKACNRIASDAIRKGSSDNVTVMMVEIARKSKKTNEYS